eukprot:578200-Amphidinium_carterae.2
MGTNKRSVFMHRVTSLGSQEHQLRRLTDGTPRAYGGAGWSPLLVDPLQWLEVYGSADRGLAVPDVLSDLLKSGQLFRPGPDALRVGVHHPQVLSLPAVKSAIARMVGASHGPGTARDLRVPSADQSDCF